MRMPKILFFTGAVFCLIHLTAFSAARYDVLVDAGSTGTRLHIYKIEASLPLPQINEVGSMKVSQALASYAEEPEQVKQLLLLLLDYAKRFFTEQGIEPQNVSFKLYATAGMRLVEKDKQRCLYDMIQAYIPTQIAFRSVEVKTISGSEEALYLWYAVNYLSGHFRRGQIPEGILDLGGASAQIAYATSVRRLNGDARYGELIPVHVNQRAYTVFTHSFLGIGERELIKQLEILFGDAIGVCFPAGYRGFMGDASAGFLWQACQQKIKTFLRPRTQALRRGQWPVQWPRILPGTRFIAVSTYAYTFNFFNIVRAFQLQRTTISQCSASWDNFVATHPKDNKTYLFGYCLMAAYIDVLLDVYPYSVRQTVQTRLGPNWALGAVLSAYL